MICKAVLLFSLIVPCKARTSVEPCQDDGLMDDDARNEFLDLNNEYRSIVANGKAEDALGGYAPRAARMPKLKYDCYLESTAMQHAKKCKFAHSNQKGRIGIGENLCTATFPKINGTKMAQICSKIWFDELKTNGVGEENMLTWTLVKRRGKPIGHYTQMVWQNTTTIGCAVALCLDSAIAVCHYKPNGNFIDEIIYDKGNTCSKCPGGQCENGLCV